MKTTTIITLLFLVHAIFLIESCLSTPVEEPPQQIEITLPETSTEDTNSTEQEETTTTIITETTTSGNAIKSTEAVVLAYFPSWSESWVSSGEGSKLRDIPPFVNHVFLAFAKPNLVYEKGSYDLSQTGIEVPYDGCMLKESVAVLRQKEINVILSVGGETYWRDENSYNIDYQQIKDLVDDIGFAGIDWDFEPDGSFQQIGNEINVNRFITFFTESRKLMPKEEGYILACAPAGVGALGGQFNDDLEAPFGYAKRNAQTGESDDLLYQGTTPTNGINLFGFSSTGHLIPVIKAVGDKIDLIAYQGYNTGASTNRKIMYDAYAYYAKQYGFTVAAGIHYPPEPWGPYYTYTHENVADLSAHILAHPNRNERNDGIMIWQLLLEGSESSGYSYMNVASKIFSGLSQTDAVAQALDFSLKPYVGGVQGCESGTGSTATLCELRIYNTANQYPEAGTQVVHECQIWESKWWVNPNEVPGNNEVWEKVGDCKEGECSD